MKAAVATLCAVLTAPCAFAQSEDALKQYFEGKTVVIKLDMPATQTGVDVYADARRPLNFDEYSARLKSTGVAIHAGESVMITKIKLKDKLSRFSRTMTAPRQLTARPAEGITAAFRQSRGTSLTGCRMT